MYKVIRDAKNKITDIVDEATGEVIQPLFADYTCPEDYIKNDCFKVEPMTAKEYLNEEMLETMLDSTDYIAEEKLDGTRCTFHIYDKNRLFSRRISKKTNWYAENTDSVIHLRDLEVDPSLKDTVLDGEMRIDGKEFKEVSSTLNCLWEEAIARQEELGYITFHAFDIIWYKGVYVARCPLWKRKEFLKRVTDSINSPYVHYEEHFDETKVVTITDKMVRDFMYKEISESAYPNLYRTLVNNIDFDIDHFELNDGYGADFEFDLEVDKRTFYEYVIYNGGEGIMLKHKNGKYYHKRGREYTKYKKFDTWDVVILDYVDPTRDYTGKEAENPSAKWDYWYDAEDDSRIVEATMTMEEAESQGLLPCTKHYAMEWVGTIKYGVLITEKELEKWVKTNPKDKPEVITIDNRHYLVVGECSGFDEETREYITQNKDKLRFTTIEVGANEIMKTGKLRHPRFMRFRDDKDSDQCIWKDHIRK